MKRYVCALLFLVGAVQAENALLMSAVSRLDAGAVQELVVRGQVSVADAREFLHRLDPRATSFGLDSFVYLCLGTVCGVVALKKAYILAQLMTGYRQPDQFTLFYLMPFFLPGACVSEQVYYAVPAVTLGLISIDTLKAVFEKYQAWRIKKLLEKVAFN